MNQTFKLLIIAMCIGTVHITVAQKTFENTLKLEENDTSPTATLADVSWISGHWKGKAFGGIAEEIWSPPQGESMMFVFRLLAEGKVVFYEVGGIRQVDDTLLMQLKHFNGDFTGWEEKDETVDFKLVKIEGNKVYFDQLTFEKISDTEMNIYVVIGHEDGSQEEALFNYHKE